MTVLESGVMHFRIDGADLMNLARRRFLERESRSAFRMLTETLCSDVPGQAEHYSAKILDGTHALEGNESGLWVTEKADAEYQAEVKRCYAGVVRIGRLWYRPKAIVLDLGPEDVPGEGGSPIPVDLPEFASWLRGWWRERNEHYKKPEEVAAQVGPHGKYILFDLCNEPPHWWPEQTNARQAVTDYLNAGNPLERTGWTAVYATMKALDVEMDRVESANVTMGRNTQGQKARRRRIKNSDPLREQKIQAVLGEQREAEEHRIRNDARKLADLRIKIQTQCGEDTFPLVLSDGRTFNVPRAPFYHWALRRTPFRHLAPAWKLCSSSGWKLSGDDPWHTDWMIGAGIDLDESYKPAVREASMEKMFEAQREVADFKVHVLVSGAVVEGIIGEDVIVLPDLSPEHLDKIRHARAILTERGGQLAHLAQVALERSIPILRVADACRIFQEGRRVTVDPVCGQVHVHADPAEGRWDALTAGE